MRKLMLKNGIVCSQTPPPNSTAVRENPHMQQGFRRVQRAPITVIDSGWLSEAVRIYYGSDATWSACFTVNTFAALLVWICSS